MLRRLFRRFRAPRDPLALPAVEHFPLSDGALVTLTVDRARVTPREAADMARRLKTRLTALGHTRIAVVVSYPETALRAEIWPGDPAKGERAHPPVQTPFPPAERLREGGWRGR